MVTEEDRFFGANDHEHRIFVRTGIRGLRDISVEIPRELEGSPVWIRPWVDLGTYSYDDWRGNPYFDAFR